MLEAAFHRRLEDVTLRMQQASGAAGGGKACGAAPAEEEEEVALARATSEFWEAQRRQACWIVPLARDDSVFASRCGMLEAIRRARASGRTPLLIDRSAHHVVDTFFSYRRSAVVLEGKRLFLEERKGTPRAELMEDARCARP